MFDAQKYQRQIEASRKRIETAKSFQEPDRVPIRISLGNSFFCNMFGIDIKDYYQAAFDNLDLQIEVQLKGQQWLFEELQDDRTGCGIHLELGPLGEGIVFNAEIVRPQGTSPWIVPFLESEADIEKLEVPDPQNNPRVLEIYRQGEKLKELVRKMGLDLPVSYGLGIHPPLSCACAIMKPTKVYELMVTDSELAHNFFTKLLQAFEKTLQFNDRYWGIKDRDSIALADDNSAFVSPRMYKHVVLPYNRAIYRKYGRKYRYLHADGPNDHLFPILAKEIKLTEMDIGAFSSMEAAVRYLKGITTISGNLNTKDLYGEFTPALRKKVKKMIRLAAPGGGYIFGIGGEAYVGIVPETLKKVVNYVKRIGKYPIS